jgi:3-oxoacyl-[acyl-carrier-protein] synthase-3
MGIKISAIGFYKPKVYVSNAIWREKFAPPVEISGHEFARMVTEGICERYYADPEETVVSMASQAIRNCLDKCRMDIRDVDLLIHASNVSDEISGDCTKIQERAGAVNAATYEVTDVACAGFLVPFQQAATFIESGLYDNVLVSCVGNAASRGGNMNDLISSALGDLATAILFSRCDGDSGFLTYTHRTIGEYAGVMDFLPVPYGIMAWPKVDKDKYWARLFHCIPMKRLLELQKATSQDSAAEVHQMLKDAHLSMSDIQWVVTHQAGGLLKLWSELFGVGQRQHLHTFPEIGNCSMSNIPYTLMKAMDEGKFHPGDKVLLFGIGTGIHLISAIWRW